MSRSLIGLAVLALVVGACGGGAAATSAPTVAPGEPAATAAPAEATQGAEATTSGGGIGGGVSADALKALAAQLTPPGATETGKLESTGVFQLYLTTTMSIDQLTAFYDEKANSIPIKDYSKLSASDGLYIGGSDPVLAIVATPDPQNAGTLALVISVGG